MRLFKYSSPLLALLVAGSAFGQSAKELRFLGFADDSRNKVLAYEVSSQPDDISGEAVVEYSFVNYGNNSLYGTQSHLGASVEEARATGRRRGVGYSGWMFYLYSYSVPGRELRVPDLGRAVDHKTGLSFPLPAPFEGFSLALDGLVSRSHLCNEYSQAGSPGEGAGFRLSLWKDTTQLKVLQQDLPVGPLPRSRGCPATYAIEKLYAHEKGGKKYLVVFLKTTESGSDMKELVRYFAVTGEVN